MKIFQRMKTQSLQVPDTPADFLKFIEDKFEVVLLMRGHIAGAQHGHTGRGSRGYEGIDEYAFII